MKNLLSLLMLLVLPILLSAQFKPMDKGLTIYVTDGTDIGTDSKGSRSMTPKAYGMPMRGKGGSSMEFTDEIKPLGMEDAIQAAAFLDRPEFGKAGFLLIFCVNDSIDGEQGYIEQNGETYFGVYRLIRQKSSPDEEIPEGMTGYKLSGLVFILGVS